MCAPGCFSVLAILVLAVAVLAAPQERPAAVAVVVTRQGGFAGFGDRLTLRRDGSWSGEGKRGARSGKLSDEQRKRLVQFLDGDLWRRHTGELGHDPRVRDGIALGFEVLSAKGSLGKLIIHQPGAKFPGKEYGELAELLGLLYREGG